MPNRVFRYVPLVVTALCAALPGCSKSQRNDYYRDRALISSMDSAQTQTVEKRELVFRPYRNLQLNGETPEAPPTNGTEALEVLRNGNKRYTEGAAIHPSQSEERRKSLTGAQHPHTAVLSCSDSRVPPEEIFDQGLGDLFVVRNAGEVADDVATASLEYAVEHLGVKMILIMGHTSCGAVKATLETPKGTNAGSKDLNTLVSIIRPGLNGIDTGSAGPGLSSAVRANVNAMANKLHKSKVIHEAVEKKGLLIARGLYNLETGKVELWF